MTMRIKVQQRYRRHNRIRQTIRGTAARPRLHVSRSLRGLYVQLIDDESGRTLLAVHSKQLGSATGVDAGDRAGKVAVAYSLGRAIAEAAKKQKIETVVFDRSGHRYHGRVKAVAEGARDGGLIF